MKILYSIGISAALILASPAPYAQTAGGLPDQQAPSVSIHANDLSIEVPDHYRKMWPADYADYVREYNLSNGMTMRVFPRGLSMYASLDNGAWHKLVATQGNTFVALDRQLKMHIDLVDDEASGEVLLVVPQRLPEGSLAAVTQPTLLYATLR